MEKRKIATIGAIIAAFGILVAATTGASACFNHAPFVFEDIDGADIIFEGDVENYEYVGCPKEPILAECYVLIDVAVRETFYGEGRENWTLYWGNSIYGIPEKWEGKKHRIFAGHWSHAGDLPVRSGSATIVESAHPELLHVLQAPCSDPFFLPADSETKTKIMLLTHKKSGAENKND